ncbi:hypothetical protein ACET3Z_010345 [Daucus carota]
MESWSYVSGERGFVSEDSATASDVIARDRNGSMDWEFKSLFYGSDNNIELGPSSQEGIESMGIIDLGVQETMRKSVSNGSIKDAYGNKLNGIRMFENAFWGGEESNSKLSSSFVEFTGAESSLIDLKLGRFDDQRDARKLSAYRVAPSSCSNDSASKTGKRMRVGGLNSLTPYCQVYGCKKDLSSCKDYHKRHKVCEVHSKTPKVIVNGIEQRFCQQCSRFHLLVEFDDGKRSCRKRLAGHNERRRKPHMGMHSGRSGRLYQTYGNGSAASRFQGTVVSTLSFNHQDILPGCLPQQQKSERNYWPGHVKLEEGADYSSQSAITVADGGLHSKSLFSSYGFDKHCQPEERIGAFEDLGSKSNGNRDQYLVRNTSFGGEAYNNFDSTVTVQALSGFSDSGRALSLLSSQSQTSMSHTSGTLLAYPLISPSSHGHYSETQASEKLLGMSPQTSRNEMSNTFASSGINSTENHLNHIITTSGRNAVVNYGIDGMFPGSGYMNSIEQLSCEGGTIDLLQLSSQLQQVEDQRQSLHEKPENDSFL